MLLTLPSGSRFYPCLAPVVAAGLSFAKPDVAMAATFQDCQAKVEALHASLPEGITGTWQEILKERLDGINAEADSEAIAGGLSDTITTYEAYQANPDPDGDGYALAPEVVEAEANLMICLYNARLTEALDAGDPEPDSAPPQAASNDDGEEEPVEDKTTPATPIGGPGVWFANIDYPVVAMREEREGVVRYEITVERDGSIAGCQASGPPGSADLESATCDALLANARFKPATDSAGAPVRSAFDGTLKWTLP